MHRSYHKCLSNKCQIKFRRCRIHIRIVLAQIMPFRCTISRPFSFYNMKTNINVCPFTDNYAYTKGFVYLTLKAPVNRADSDLCL